jgi:phosphoserine aminotransferase
MSPKTAFIDYCENETVDGVQFSHEDTFAKRIPQASS